MFSMLVDVCKNIIDLIRENEKVKREDKDRISLILEELSKIIDDSANKIMNNHYPHGNCRIMENLSNSLHFYLMDYIDQKDVDNLHSLLLECSTLEKEYYERENPETVKKLQIASGEFKTLSLLLKF